MQETMSFNDLALDYPGRVTLSSSLAANRSLGTARLVCRGLRELVDGGITELKLEMRRSQFEELEQWCRARGHPFRSPLLRWPVVQRLSVELVASADWLVETLRWLFTGIPADALARITVLGIIDTSLYIDYRLPVSSLLAALPPQLSALKTLDILECCSPVHPSTDPPDVFIALGDRFPALEDLALPKDSCLDGVEALAGLRGLRIGPEAGIYEWSPSPSFVEAMSSLWQLTRLRELCLTDCYFSDSDELGRFLGAVPLGVEALKLEDLSLFANVGCGGQLGTVRMQLEGGRLMVVEVACGWSLRWEGLELEILAEGLLGWAALGPQLPRLQIRTLNIETSGLPAHPATPRMRELLLRCVHTEVVFLQSDVSPLSALSASRAVQALGAPRFLSLRFDLTRDRIPFNLQQATAAVATPGLALETAEPEQVWQEAVRRVREIAGNQQAELAAEGSSSERPAMAAAGGSRTLSIGGGSGGVGRVVLLCGHPSQDWRTWLDRLPAEAPMLDRLPAEAPWLLPWPLPTAAGGSPEGARLSRSTMLVGCNRPEEAAALAALATATTGTGDEMEGGMEAFQVPYNTVREAALCLLKPVLQDLWAGSAGGGGASVPDRVERLMGLMRGIGRQVLGVADEESEDSGDADHDDDGDDDGDDDA